MKLSLLTNASLVLPKQVAPKQQGGMLIESLIGVLIMAIIGGGIMHVTARMLNTQRDVAVTNIAINELRPLIMSRKQADGTDLCGAGTLSVTVPGIQNAVTVDKTVCEDSASIEIKDAGGVTKATVTAPKPAVLSIGNSSDGSLISIGGNQ